MYKNSIYINRTANTFAVKKLTVLVLIMNEQQKTAKTDMFTVCGRCHYDFAGHIVAEA